MHLAYANHVEAAMCSMAMADDIAWPDTRPEAGPFLSLQAFSRKETMYKVAAKHFCDAKYWERGIAVLEELREQFESIDMPKQPSATRQIIATKTAGLNMIIHGYMQTARSKERILESYFFVEFFGRDLVASKAATTSKSTTIVKSNGDRMREESLFGKKYIIKGDEGERIGHFIAKLKARWPVADITSTADPIQASVTGSPLSALHSLLL